MQIISALLIALVLCIQDARAASIIQLKEKRILAQLDETDNISLRHRFFLIDKEGNKVAEGSVTQIRKRRAILTIEKGKYRPGAWIRFFKPLTEADLITADGPPPLPVYRVNSPKYSALLTIGSNTMVTKQTDGANPTPNTEDVSMKGTSFGVTGAMDFPVNDWLILRGTLGYEPFKVSGTSRFISCNNLTSTNCNANIDYLSAGGYLRFDLNPSQALYWLAAGGTFKIPFGKSTTALVAEDVKMTMTFALAGGLDYFISNKNFIPVSLEYQMFQSSDTVSANIIMLRGGYGWAF